MQYGAHHDFLLDAQQLLVPLIAYAETIAQVFADLGAFGVGVLVRLGKDAPPLPLCPVPSAVHRSDLGLGLQVTLGNLGLLVVCFCFRRYRS